MDTAELQESSTLWYYRCFNIGFTVASYKGIHPTALHCW